MRCRNGAAVVEIGYEIDRYGRYCLPWYSNVVGEVCTPASVMKLQSSEPSRESNFGGESRHGNDLVGRVAGASLGERAGGDSRRRNTLEEVTSA
jgi:hypothetical protein